MHKESKCLITAHCAERLRQRGYLPADLETIERLGTWCKDGVILRKRDVEPELELLAMQRKMIRQQRGALSDDAASAESEVIRRMERVRRLIGSFIPVEEGHALSIYRPCERRFKRVLRGRRGRGRRRR